MQAGRVATPGLTFDGWTIVLGLFVLVNLANGIWMLADPVPLLVLSVAVTGLSRLLAARALARTDAAGP